MTATMTIGDLRKAIAAISPELDVLEVILRVQGESSMLLGGLSSLEIGSGCGDVNALVIDADHDAKPAPVPMCEHCGLRPATCLGNYEDHSVEDCEFPGVFGCSQHGRRLACDECCGHANEDGHCQPIRIELLS